MTPTEIVKYLRTIEADLSKATNDGKAAEAAYQRVIDRCRVAANMLEDLTNNQ